MPQLPYELYCRASRFVVLGRELRSQQARRLAAETAGTAILLFTKRDARKYIPQAA